MTILSNLQPCNPKAATVVPHEDITGDVFTVRDDGDTVVFASVSAGECARYMRTNDPDGWSLRCFTEDGRPVSLLNV